MKLSRNSPNHIIADMYLEINTLSQALNIGLIVLSVASVDVVQQSIKSYFSFPLFALSNFLISIIFYTRYYFDTEILQRSFTNISIFWYFSYIVAQGVSISFISSSVLWFIATGVFLAFGAGFYLINLLEICRKEKVGAITFPRFYYQWQQRRMIELFVLSILSFGGAFLVTKYPQLALIAALITLCGAVWQFYVNNDYRKLKFIEVGI